MAYRYGKPLTLAMASPHCGRRQQLMAAENTPIKILSVDDHPLLREGIAALLEGQRDMVLVGESANGRDAIETFRAHRPDVTLMDLQMPEINGIEAIIAIRREFPGARIVALTTYKGDVRAARAFSAGASGFLLKSAVRKDFLDTIRTVHGGRKQIPPEIAAENCRASLR
jgi:DNA-binding NarL/FixJ family response regulator